ncbi:recombinase family protein [Nocardia fluminea]|uniref:recombinase family protein n=1 Tax=Nocardia fluminea TaxID=134984 RepID=UPI0033F00A6B
MRGPDLLWRGSAACTSGSRVRRGLRVPRPRRGIDVLVVYRVDRLSRNLRDLVTLLDELDQAKVVFRSATEPFDTSTPMGGCWCRCWACSPKTS